MLVFMPIVIPQSVAQWFVTPKSFSCETLLSLPGLLEIRASSTKVVAVAAPKDPLLFG